VALHHAAARAPAERLPLHRQRAGASLALEAEESHPPSRSVKHLIARPRPTKQQPILMMDVLE
jgi:hypothetical protein